MFAIRLNLLRLRRCHRKLSRGYVFRIFPLKKHLPNLPNLLFIGLTRRRVPATKTIKLHRHRVAHLPLHEATVGLADLLEWVEQPADTHARKAEDRREVVTENDHGTPPAADEACSLEGFFILLGEFC